MLIIQKNKDSTNRVLPIKQKRLPIISSTSTKMFSTTFLYDSFSNRKSFTQNQKSSSMMSSISTKMMFCKTFLYNSLSIRKILQKVEFFMYWAIFLLAAVRSTNTSLVEQTSPLLVLSHTVVILYFKFSVLTRSYAYAIDIVNAWVRFDSSIPKWSLVLHHSGVLSIHVIKAFYHTPQNPLEIMVFALGSQSTHNTWTKKYSLFLYWGNVIFGGLVVVYDLNRFEDERSMLPSRCLYYSFLVTSVGILLLILHTCISSKNKKKSNGHDVTRTKVL